MRLGELVREIGGRVLTHDNKAGTAEIEKIYAGDSMNDMFNEASDTTLLVTNLSNTVLVRVAELTGVPGICLLNDSHPEQEVLDAATEHGAVLIVSPLGMFETCGRLYGRLNLAEDVLLGKVTEKRMCAPSWIDVVAQPGSGESCRPRSLQSKVHNFRLKELNK